jgi:hypothetical protein
MHRQVSVPTDNTPTNRKTVKENDSSVVTSDCKNMYGRMANVPSAWGTAGLRESVAKLFWSTRKKTAAEIARVRKK